MVVRRPGAGRPGRVAGTVKAPSVWTLSSSSKEASLMSTVAIDGWRLVGLSAGRAWSEQSPDGQGVRPGGVEVGVETNGSKVVSRGGLVRGRRRSGRGWAAWRQRVADAGSPPCSRPRSRSWVGRRFPGEEVAGADVFPVVRGFPLVVSATGRWVGRERLAPAGAVRVRRPVA